MSYKHWNQVDEVRIEIEILKAKDGFTTLRLLEVHIPTGKVMTDKEIQMQVHDIIHLEGLLKDEDGAIYSEIKYSQEII
ncbi:MAG: hypothetical protein H6961_10750 [Chromatiaceae bacterium]|nr:hypothetical protein [Chromatiaceae bacterium]